MICYFIKGTEFVDADNYRGFEAKQLTDKDRKIVRENVKKLTQEIGEGKNIYLYSQDVVPSIETMMIAFNELLLGAQDKKNLLVKEENVFIDERLNPARLSAFFNKKNYKPAKDKQYIDRVFESLAEIIMSHSQDDIVLLFGDDDLFKACQKNIDLHSLIYFGDEYINDESMWNAVRNEKSYMGMVPENKIIDMLVPMDYFINLQSRIEPKTFVPQKLILEKPGFENGMTISVFEKYARQKLEEKQKIANQPGDN